MPHTPPDDYANRPPPIPLPSSPSYSYYLQAVEGSLIDQSLDSISSPLASSSSAPDLTALTRVNRRKSTASISSLEHDETSESDDSTTALNMLKTTVFAFLNPKQHLALSLCRDMPIWYCVYYMVSYFYIAYSLQLGEKTHISPEESRAIALENLLTTRSSEYFMTGIWCFVTAFMVYSILDGLMVRWIVIYTIPAAIVRMLLLSVVLISVIRLVMLVCNPNDSYLLHSWIFISCVFTGVYIVQNFFVHNLNEKLMKPSNDSEEGEQDTRALSNILNGRVGLSGKASRYFNYYNIVIYAVMPIGVASFVTMAVLLRNILILKLDVETVYGV